VAGDDALIGQVVGRWRVTRLIGAGGMGRVYEAVQPEIGARVAIKVLRADSTPDRHSGERFFNEARAVNLVRHENIVDVIDLAYLPDGSPYIVMEYLDGASLAALFKRGSGIALGVLARVVGEVLAALEAAHGKGVVHRDLKPDNVFVSPSGRVKVLDFGIAKLARDGGPLKTQTGMLLGTPAYMAPEQARSQPVDARADLYAAGVILYEGATGAPPFVAENVFDVLDQHVRATPAPPSSKNSEVPAELDAVILRALAKDPAARFATAREMRDALARAVAGLPVPSLDVPAPVPADPLAETAASTEQSLARGEPRARAPRARSAWIGGGVAAGALAVGAWWLASGSSPQPLPRPLPLPLPQPQPLPQPLPQPPPQPLPSAATATVPPQPQPQPQPPAQPQPRPQPQPQPLPQPQPQPPPSPSPHKDALPRNKDGTYAVPWNPRAFELRRTYAAMHALAAKVAGAPVAPYMLALTGLDHDGRPLPTFTADFQFISTEAADAGRKCLYNIAIRGTTAYMDTGNFEDVTCDAPSVGGTRCSFPALIAAAEGNGLAKDSTDPISLSRTLVGKWDFRSGAFHLILDDDCE